jgi:hypothetical protein
MSAHIPKVLSKFVAEEIHSCQPIEHGHIHATFRVETRGVHGASSYVLQRLNTGVFRNPAAVMQNIVLVTGHVRRKLIERGTEDVGRRVLQVIPSVERLPYYVDTMGEYWRLYHYVDDAHTVTDTPQLDEIYEAAYGFGEFISLLADFPQSQLMEAIPNFHHGPPRFKSFQAAVRDDTCQRAAAVRDEIEFILEHETLLAEPQRLIDEQMLPLRVTHNDTKSNNVLLDNSTRKALCIIDLDTVMPGLALYDFGDLVRTTVTGAAEDECDLDRVHVQLPRFERALRGFIDGTHGQLRPHETQSLLLGPCYMALIMAVRFLTDYLQGDSYYRIQHAGHNLQRCRAQLALARSLEASHHAIAELANEILNRGPSLDIKS